MEKSRREPPVELLVNGEPWQRVDSLERSGPEDRHYVARLGADGRMEVTFGDGRRGARPPTGGRIAATTYRPSAHYTGVVMQQGRVVLDQDWNEEPSKPERLCGIYRASVVDNVDPLSLKRLRVRVPEALGTAEAWAVACLPVGRSAIPAVGQIVWVEFEAGDPDRPVWLGIAVVRS